MLISSLFSLYIIRNILKVEVTSSLFAERPVICDHYTYTLSREPLILQVEALKLFYRYVKILIGKILTMKLWFVKVIKIFPRQTFAPYGNDTGAYFITTCQELCFKRWHLPLLFVTGYWITDPNVTLGLFHFIAQLIATFIHSSIALPGLADWSTFLEQVLLTM